MLSHFQGGASLGACRAPAWAFGAGPITQVCHTPQGGSCYDPSVFHSPQTQHGAGLFSPSESTHGGFAWCPQCLLSLSPSSFSWTSRSQLSFSIAKSTSCRSAGDREQAAPASGEDPSPGWAPWKQPGESRTPNWPGKWDHAPNPGAFSPAERSRLPPGPPLCLPPDGHHLHHRPPLVCLSHCHLPGTHGEPEEGECNLSPRRAPQVPGHQVNNKPGPLLGEPLAHGC